MSKELKYRVVITTVIDDNLYEYSRWIEEVSDIHEYVKDIEKTFDRVENNVKRD